MFIENNMYIYVHIGIIFYNFYNNYHIFMPFILKTAENRGEHLEKTLYKRRIMYIMYSLRLCDKGILIKLIIYAFLNLCESNDVFINYFFIIFLKIFFMLNYFITKNF